MNNKYEYTLDDCDCIYCLFRLPKHKCQLEVCCCLEEKNVALAKLQVETGKSIESLISKHTFYPPQFGTRLESHEKGP